MKMQSDKLLGMKAETHKGIERCIVKTMLHNIQMSTSEALV